MAQALGVVGVLQRGDGLLALADVVTTVDADARAAAAVGHAVVHAVQAVLGADVVAVAHALAQRAGVDLVRGRSGAHQCGSGSECQVVAFHVAVSRLRRVSGRYKIARRLRGAGAPDSNLIIHTYA